MPRLRVVPIPAHSGFRAASAKIALLAWSTAARSSWSYVPCGMSSGVVKSGRIVRATALTAVRLATSPRRWPPMPSHHQEQPGPRLGQVRRLDLHGEETVFVDRSDFPDVRGEPEPTTGRTNHGVRGSCRPSVFYDFSRHAQDPLRRWPPLKAIVMYGPLPGLYTRATTSPSVSSWRLNPGICWYVLPPSCDMAVPFKLPKSSIQHR